MIAEQLEKTEEDIEYFEMIKQQVMQASPDDIAEIREELAELGFMKARNVKKRKKPKKPKPETYTSSTGIKISVGKNNKQNDYLTFKIAARDHIWFHTKDIPGSHVVIHDETPDEKHFTKRQCYLPTSVKHENHHLYQWITQKFAM